MVIRDLLELLHVAAWGAIGITTAYSVLAADTPLEAVGVTLLAVVAVLAWIAVGEALGLGERGDRA